MAAILYRARAELRESWRVWLVIALVLGGLIGAAMGAAIGARRTNSAFPRFVQHTDAFDVAIPQAALFGELFADLDLDHVAASSYVARSIRTTEFVSTVLDIPVTGARDPRFGYKTHRLVSVEGRLPRSDSIDEISIPFAFRDQIGAAVGERYEVGLLTPEGEPLRLSMRVVGVHVVASEFPPVNESLFGAFVSPAFHDRYKDRAFSYEILAVWLKDRADLRAFVEEVNEQGGGKLVVTLQQDDVVRSVQVSNRLQAGALWLLALLGGGAILLVMVQVIHRQVLIESRDRPRLTALGYTRRLMVGVTLLRTMPSALLAAVVGGATAIGVSAFFPRGLTRVAEPSPGITFDWIVIGVGSTSLLVLFLAVVTLAAVRGGIGDARARQMRLRPSIAARAMSAIGLSAPAVSGARLALEPGRGSTMVPVRSTILSAATGIVAIVGALTFGNSLEHLLRTPALYGVTWDVILAGTEAEDAFWEDARPAAELLVDHQMIDAMSVGSRGIPMEIEGTAVSAIALSGVKGAITPPLIDGRHPVAGDEILLGPATMRQVGAHVGDRITIGLEGADPQQVTVVGRAIVPPVALTTRFGEGVFLSWEALERIADASPALAGTLPAPDELAIRFRPGTDRDAAIADLREELGSLIQDELVLPGPSDVVSFGRVRNMPLILAGIVAVLSAATFLHALITAIGRRRRDMAILKALGFGRRHVLRTIRWQAVLLALATIAVAVPVGVMAGRGAWIAYARSSGLGAVAVIPASVWLVPVAAIGFAVLAAVMPARAAARTRPAQILRAE